MIGKIDGEFPAHAFGRAPTQRRTRNLKGRRIGLLPPAEQLDEFSFVFLPAEPVVGKLGISVDGPDILLDSPSALGGRLNDNIGVRSRVRAHHKLLGTLRACFDISSLAEASNEQK